MIKFFKKWICKIFHIKQCECPTDVDPHEELYLHKPEPEVPIHVEETAKQKKIREKHKGDK